MTKTIALISATWLAANAASVSADTQNKTDSIDHTEAFAVEFISPLVNQHWLISDAHQGLVIVNNDMETVASKAGKYEQTASTPLKSGELIAVINSEHNQLELLHANEGRIHSIDSQAEGVAELTGVCLYSDDGESLVYAYLLKDEQQVEQRLVYDKRKNLPLNKFVRHLPGGSSISACATYDDKVVFAEDYFGVWETVAHPEASSVRRLVASSRSQALPEEWDALHITETGFPWFLTDNKLVTVSADTKVIAQPLTVAVEDEAIFGLARVNDNTLEILVNTETGLTKETISFETTPRIDTRRKFPVVPALVQSDDVGHYGDAADDPAIWIHPTVPKKSLVFGTDKKRGLAVYNLAGKEIQFLNAGRLNNVDVRENVNGHHILVTASDRDNNAVQTFILDKASLTLKSAGSISTSLDEVYGLCMYQNATTLDTYVLINDKDGRVELIKTQVENGVAEGVTLSTIQLPEQPEGCVADDTSGELYMGVENLGIWYSNITNFLSEKSAWKADKIIGLDNNLRNDVEGMALYMRDTGNLLVVSSQGNDSYAIYDASAPFAYRGSFYVGTSPDYIVDGASETDGLDVTSAPLGRQFPLGLLVVQDGRNVMPAAPQNFKYVSMKDVLAALNIQ